MLLGRGPGSFAAAVLRWVGWARVRRPGAQRKNRLSESRQIAREKLKRFNGVFGRGSWIRTNDLQYPKLPRYQAALYPDWSNELAQ